MKRLATILLLSSAAPIAAQTIEAEKITVGEDATQDIETNLDGSPVRADIGQIYIGNTTESADAITIDSGSNFPPGIAFRRYLGDPSDPSVVTAGTQLGYLDFRGYSGTQFWNAGSFDMVVDGAVPFQDGELFGTKMRFAVSDGDRVYIPMELRANGGLEIGAIVGTSYFGPGTLGQPKLFVNTVENKWATIFAARPAEGPGFALRTHTRGETSQDYLFGASSGEDSGTFKFSVRGNGDVHVGGSLYLGSVDLGAVTSQLGDRVEFVETEVGRLDGRIDDVADEVGSLRNQFGNASGTGSTALGSGALATSANSTAIGRDSIASGSNALAVGNAARANGSSAISLGDSSIASGVGAVAFGSTSVSTAMASTALGQASKALRDNALAVGAGALAQGVNASAVGTKAVALEVNSTAVGGNARAAHENSTAVGAGAVTTKANQVVLGGSGSAVKIGDIEASTAAQVGPVEVVTVDSSGTLGRKSAVSTAQLETVRVSMIDALAVTDTQFAALSDRVGTLEGRVGELFDLASVQTKQTRQGIAAIASMAQPHFPSGAGRTSYASNIAHFRGEVGVSAGLMHRFEGDFAITAGLSYAGGNNTAVKAGVAGEF